MHEKIHEWMNFLWVVLYVCVCEGMGGGHRYDAKVVSRMCTWHILRGPLGNLLKL